jgi:hypothetical protein
VTYVFSLASLDPEKFSVELSKGENEPPKYDLILNARDGKKAIKRATVSRSNLYSPRNYESMMNIMALSFDNEETAHSFEKRLSTRPSCANRLPRNPFDKKCAHPGDLLYSNCGVLIVSLTKLKTLC